MTSIRDRIVELRRVRASDLLPDPRNWRRHGKAQRDALTGVLRETGYADALLARETPEGLRLIDGHLRADLDPNQGVPVLVLDLDEVEAGKLLATLDPLAAMAQPDQDALLALLESVSFQDVAVNAMLEALANGETQPLKQFQGQTDPDDVPLMPEESYVKRDDIWQLGEHRVMCGDSTEVEDVERLMQGVKADMVFTDPPFGNNLGYGRGQLGERYVEGDGNTVVLSTLPDVIDSNLKNNSHCLIWIQWRTFVELATLFQNYKLRTVVVWDKKQAGLSGGGFAEQHEWLAVFIKGNATQREYSGNVWQVSRESSFHGRVIHPTMKPVELIERGIYMCSIPDNTILDLFLGSGTTIIACEKLGRKCMGMEISERYVQVTIERWQNFTGKKAVKVNA